MTKKMKKILVALLLGFTLISVAQEKALLRLNYEKGDVYTVDLKINQIMGAGIMTNTTLIQMNNEITNVEGATFESKSKITRMTLDMNQGGMKMSYDSDKKAEELDDMGKMMMANMKPMLEAVIITKGDNLGNINEVSIEPNVPGANDLTNQSTSIIYPKEEVAVGETWTMSKSNKGMDFNFEYTVSSITPKKVVLDVSGKISGIAEGTITGSMNIERATGIPTTSNLDMAMKVQGQEAATKISATTTKQ